MSSKILVDELAGKTAAGNITVTSEGGSATMQLQQGLAKAFGSFDQRGDKIAANTAGDTFNISSISDTGAGFISTSLTNSMSSTEYSSVSNIHYSALGADSIYARFSASSAYTSSSFTTVGVYVNGTAQDGYFTLNVHGDLA